MAISAPRCEIRALVLHIYPDGIKEYGHERITQPIGRRGKPIKMSTRSGVVTPLRRTARLMAHR
jgi:hypothetical protein